MQGLRMSRCWDDADEGRKELLMDAHNKPMMNAMGT